MLIRKIGFFCFGIVFLPVCLLGMDFNSFKQSIMDKTGEEVYNSVASAGLDQRFGCLRDHASKHGHFGSKTTITRGNTRMTWNTFFVKPSGDLYSSEEEQLGLLRTIWDSKQLVYTKDVPGADGVCLDGSVEGVRGVAFRNKGV